MRRSWYVPAIEQMFGAESGMVRRLVRRRRTVHRGEASAVTRLQGRLRDVEVAAAGAAGDLLRLLNQRRQGLDDADLAVLEDLADRMGEARAAAWRGAQDLAGLRCRRTPGAAAPEPWRPHGPA